MTPTDIRRVECLRDARATRLAILYRDLHSRQAALAEAKAAVQAIQDELHQAQRQRASWEGEWQSWMSAHGILSRGEDYNRYHIALTAWERDVREELEEALSRAAAAAKDEATARERVVRAHKRLEVLRRHIDDQRRAAARDQRAREARQSADLPHVANGSVIVNAPAWLRVRQ
jgi:hypothetical protein